MAVFTTRIIFGFVLWQEALYQKHLIIALDDDIISNDILQVFQHEYESCLKLLNGYIQYLKKKKIDELT